MAVLGALLLEKDAYLQVCDILKPDYFYADAHKTIYGAIAEMNERNNPVDMLTVTVALKKAGRIEEVGGAVYITQLTGRVASAAHIEHHALVIKDQFIKRSAVFLGAELQNIGFDETADSADILDKAIKINEELVNLTTQQNRILTFDENLQNSVDAIVERERLTIAHTPVGIPPRLNSVKRYIHAFKGGQLILIAARPAMGKTSYALSLTRHMAKLSNAVIVFSLEMTRQELTDRNLLSTGSVSAHNFNTGCLTPHEWEKLDHGLQELQGLPIFIDDTPLCTYAHIRKVAKLYKSKGLCGAIVIDYLQLMKMVAKNRSYNREQEIGETSRSLKALAKELDVPIFLLSQLNRGTESRTTNGHRPLLSDLRESGGLEQDADIVIFPHRPAYYKPDDPDLTGLIELIIAKNRGGKIGTAYAMHNSTISEFTDTDISPTSQQTIF